MDADHAPGYGKTPKHIVGGRHQALRVVTSSLMLEPAAGIEFRPDLAGCRKVILRAIESHHRHAVPQIAGVSRVEAVGKLHGLLQDVPEGSPGDLPASQGERTAVDLPGIGPKTASPGRSEKIPGLDVDSLALPARHQRKNEGDELGKGEFAVSGEVFGRLFGVGVNLFWDEIEKSCKNRGKLA